VNASNIAKDLAYFQEHVGGRCEITNNSDSVALIAVQGPSARGLIARLAGDALLQVPAFSFAAATLAGADIVAARTGYTGEDGFELFVAADRAVAVWDALLAEGAAPIGL